MEEPPTRDPLTWDPPPTRAQTRGNHLMPGLHTESVHLVPGCNEHKSEMCGCFTWSEHLQLKLDGHFKKMHFVWIDREKFSMQEIDIQSADT